MESFLFFFKVIKTNIIIWLEYLDLIAIVEFGGFWLFFFYLCLCIILIIIILISSFILGPRFSIIEYDKLSGYECGFDSFQEARTDLYTQFYIVAVLYIIFDVEILLILPWVLNAYILGYLGLFVLFSFLILLALGLFYEWKVRALEFDK